MLRGIAPGIPMMRMLSGMNKEGRDNRSLLIYRVNADIYFYFIFDLKKSSVFSYASFVASSL